MIRLGIEEAAAELDRRAVDAERRTDQRREGPMSTRSFLHSLTDNKTGAGILIALLLFAATWFTSVSDAREKVAGHSLQLAGQAQRIEQLERNEIRTTEELKYIRLKLTEIADAVNQRRPR